jgi:hypothetical protein
MVDEIGMNYVCVSDVVMSGIAIVSVKHVPMDLVIVVIVV